MSAVVVRYPDRPYPSTWSTATKVRECVHDWVSIYIEDAPDHFIEADRCSKCHAPRCEHDSPNGACVLLRGHATRHLMPTGDFQ